MSHCYAHLEFPYRSVREFITNLLSAIVAVSSALAAFGIVGAGFCYHRVRRNSKVRKVLSIVITVKINRVP